MTDERAGQARLAVAGAKLAVTEARAAVLEGIVERDDQRLLAAAEKAGITFYGCDTPDWLAETVVESRHACAAYRAMLIRLLSTARWAEPTCVYCLGIRPDHGPACPEIATQALLLSPDPAASVAERLAAGERLAGAIRAVDLCEPQPEFPGNVNRALKELHAALAAYDKLVSP